MMAIRDIVDINANTYVPINEGDLNLYGIQEWVDMDEDYLISSAEIDNNITI